MYLSCTKGNLRLPWRRYVWVCVRNTAQLVAIDSNRHLSRIVINLTELLHRTNWIMEYDGSDAYENLTLAMVAIVMLLNDIPHVWHKLVTNLEMNTYN